MRNQISPKESGGLTRKTGIQTCLRQPSGRECDFAFSCSSEWLAFPSRATTKGPRGGGKKLHIRFSSSVSGLQGPLLLWPACKVSRTTGPDGSKGGIPIEDPRIDVQIACFQHLHNLKSSTQSTQRAVRLMPNDSMSVQQNDQFLTDSFPLPAALVLPPCIGCNWRHPLPTHPAGDGYPTHKPDHVNLSNITSPPPPRSFVLRHEAAQAEFGITPTGIVYRRG